MKDQPQIGAVDSNLRLALTLAETADALGVSLVTVHRLRQRGLLRASKALRRPLFPVTEIQRFLADSM